MSTAQEEVDQAKLHPLASVDCGVDYLTCSYKPGPTLSRLKFYLARLEEQELNAGFFSSPWNLYGYKGYRVGGLNYGWRDDGLLVRLEGPVAQRWWRRFGALASNCSRIDVQDTWLYEEQPSVVLDQHWTTMVQWWKEKKDRPKPVEIGGPRGIETIYSGQRVSDVYLRCYDRYAKKKQKEFKGHVRYEAEIKGDRALQLLTFLVPTRRARVECAAKCLELFSKRGCSPPSRVQSSATLSCNVRVSDVQKRLTWLRQGVKPSVQALIESGYIHETLEALGLSWTIGPGGPSDKEE